MSDSHIDITADVAPSTQVVEAITELEDTDQCELPPLFDAIDPEALNVITQEHDATVSFQYYDYTIEIRGTAKMIVQPTE